MPPGTNFSMPFWWCQTEMVIAFKGQGEWHAVSTNAPHALLCYFLASWHLCKSTRSLCLFVIFCICRACLTHARLSKFVSYLYPFWLMPGTCFSPFEFCVLQHDPTLLQRQQDVLLQWTSALFTSLEIQLCLTVTDKNHS